VEQAFRPAVKLTERPALAAEVTLRVAKAWAHPTEDREEQNLVAKERAVRQNGLLILLIITRYNLYPNSSEE
jgi:hypothetical protein